MLDFKLKKYISDRAGEPIACGKISLAHDIHSCPNVFISFVRPVSLCCEEFVCIYVYIVKLIKMCLTETYSRVRVGKNLSDMFPISNGLKQGDALSPLLFNFALGFAIRRVQVNQDGLKLNGTLQLLAYADNVHILGGSVDTVKKNAEA